MAKRDSTSKIGRGRRSHAHRDERSSSPPHMAKGAQGDSPKVNSFEDFGGERSRLLKAEAVLNCLTASLNYAAWDSDDGTMHAMAVDVARGLVQESLDRLEERDRQIKAGKTKPK